ncbi:MAG: hypothetical protein BYD32DRAFT_433910 [Podila humilis]|nr:MAG: hypothetical protein BYD32DRAFT_433910 [Podila humilis]
MSNSDSVQCTDPHCTNTYGTKQAMQEHYIAKHTSERFHCRFPGYENSYNFDNNRINHERKIHELYHCHGSKSGPCNQSIKGSQNWKMHQKKHRPYPCPESGCDKSYADPKGLREHRKTAHTGNNQSRSNPPPPSKLIPVVPQPEPVLNEETKQPIPNEYKVPVVYKGNLVQAIELTVKWYEFIYKPGTTPMEKDDKELVPHPEYWLDGRKLSPGEKRWFDLLSKFDFFVSSTFYGKKCNVCQTEMGHWYEGLREGKSYLTVRAMLNNMCKRCYIKQRYEVIRNNWAKKTAVGVQPEDPKSRTCPHCGKNCSRDNCNVHVAYGRSWYRPLCKDCERLKRASLSPDQRSATYFVLWWFGRRFVFKSRVQADGFALTVFHCGICAGVPQLSGREVAHLRLQTQGSTSIDWYDHKPLVAGDRDPMKRFSTDRTTSGRDKKMLPYSHRRQCTVAASAWKNALFWDMALEQRVEYMLYWCDPEKREEGFRKADAILLKLFEGFNLEEEMKIGFTDRDEYYWRVFNNNRRNKKERVAWNKYEWRYFLRTCNGIDLCSGLSMAKIGEPGNIDRLSSDGTYRLGACIYIPQGLNFAKELLEDFQTLKLFQGTDLENCRKGIKMLRELMIETAEKTKHRLPKLLKEHATLIAGSKDSDNEEAQVAEETVENICDQYEPEPYDMATTDCNNLDMIRAIDNTIEYEKDAPKSSNLMAPKIDLWKYEEEVAASFWALAESDEEDSFSDVGHDDVVPTLSLGVAEDVSQGDSKLFQRHVDHGETDSRSDASLSTLTPPLLFEERSDLIDLPKHTHARCQGEKGESMLKRTHLVEYNNQQGCAHENRKSRLNDTKALQNSVVPKTAMDKNMEQMIGAAAVLSKRPSVASSWKQPLISDFLFRRDKENQPSQTTLITQYFSSEHRSTTSDIEIPNHSHSEQLKVAGHVTNAAKRKDIESGKEAATWASDDDFMPSRVTTKNVPITKKASTKKQRR